MRMDGPTFLMQETGDAMNPNTFFAKHTNNNEADQLQLFLKNLANAIAQNELCLHYQPRYSTPIPLFQRRSRTA